MESCRGISRPTYSFVSIVMHILGGASAGRTLRTRCGTNVQSQVHIIEADLTHLRAFLACAWRGSP